MAIYHLEAKVISRGVGRSAVAASAYMSCSRIYNDYDGIQHDYTRKQGLVYEQVLLPPQAPPEWTDRSILWNAVEETEKTKDSRLAREFVVALPTELSKEENISLLTEYVQENFVNDGMCADFCIHDTDGHNPHAHIMLTVRPLDENGKWQSKTEKEYLCIKEGEERGFTSSEFKTAQLDGWEKQYQYIVGKKKVYMPPSQAELHGYERASKYPKSTRYGRQNPIAERWNSEEQLLIWRKNWADINNLYLERKNLDERIDHRSHKERGIDEQPTIHEGVTTRIIEQKGGTSERCEINRQIKADNKLLRELKKQYAKLVEAVKYTVASVSKVFETLRKNMICYRYNIEATSFWKMSKKIEVTLNENDSVAMSDASSKGITEGITTGVSMTQSKTKTKGRYSGVSAGISANVGISEIFGIGASLGMNRGKNESVADQTGKTTTTTKLDQKTETVTFTATSTTTVGRSLQLNYENRSVKALMDKIDIHLERLNECESFGAFDCAAYIIADTAEESLAVASNYNALMRGQESCVGEVF